MFHRISGPGGKKCLFSVADGFNAVIVLFFNIVLTLVIFIIIPNLGGFFPGFFKYDVQGG